MFKFLMDLVAFGAIIVVGVNFIFEDYLLFPEILSFWLSIGYFIIRIIINSSSGSGYGSSDDFFDYGGGGGFIGDIGGFGGDGGGCGGGD